MIRKHRVTRAQAVLLEKLSQQVQLTRGWAEAAEEKFILATEAMFAGRVKGDLLTVVAVDVRNREVSLDDAPRT